MRKHSVERSGHYSVPRRSGQVIAKPLLVLEIFLKKKLAKWFCAV
jgi:hypothetical protein